MDSVFIERLWRSLTYECIYLHAFETGSALRAGLTRWTGYYNARRPHPALAGCTSDGAYDGHTKRHTGQAGWRDWRPDTTRTKLSQTAKLSEAVGPPQ